MAQIKVSNLTYAYEGSMDNVFENISFNIDSDWKIGFVGRNGKGKTTLLNLLMDKYSYKGSIVSNMKFDYFPYSIASYAMEKCAYELIEEWKPEIENWQVLIELNEIGMDAECLYRPFNTLSFGERTRVMLAVLFAGDNEFLLIDEPTNHLDVNAREIVKDFLKKKKGFILVSHDRDLLDAVCDHMLVFNKETVSVQMGNFTSWWNQKEMQDVHNLAENEKHKKEIGRLKSSIDRFDRWAKKGESTKIGFDPIKENDRSIATRATIGAKTKKMNSRIKSFEKRVDREISEKEGLLKDIESVKNLKINPLEFHKKTLVNAYDLSLQYEGMDELFADLRFDIKQGERVLLSGANGCGKSSIIKAILSKINNNNYLNETSNKDNENQDLITNGTLEVPKGLVISYINQDTSNLSGTLKEYAEKNGLDETLFLTVLRQLDFERSQYNKRIEDFSEGQKKKVLIAASLITPAHLYIWDEPLNYIDVFSRMQIEKLILDFKPTMLIVEHDVRFKEKIATKEIIVK